MVKNLLPGPDPTYLPSDSEVRQAIADGASLEVAAANFPSYSYPWARLAQHALEAGQNVTAYAYARTGYHRGLDALRRAGWKGHGPIPVDHEPNQGFLLALLILADAAEAIGETEEADRCRTFAADSDPNATQIL